MKMLSHIWGQTNRPTDQQSDQLLELLEWLFATKNTESIHSLIGDYQLTVRSWSGVEFIIHWSHSQSFQIDVQKLKNYVLEVCILICLNHTKSPDWPLCGEEQDIICIIWRFFKDLDDFSDIITGNDWNSVHRMLEDSMQIVLIWTECMIRRAQDNLASLI